MLFGSVCVGDSGQWGVDGSWMPLPTHPQRYCDPVSLVSTKVIVRPSIPWSVSPKGRFTKVKIEDGLVERSISGSEQSE